MKNIFIAFLFTFASAQAQLLSMNQNNADFHQVKLNQEKDSAICTGSESYYTPEVLIQMIVPISMAVFMMILMMISLMFISLNAQLDWPMIQILIRKYNYVISCTIES